MRALTVLLVFAAAGMAQEARISRSALPPAVEKTVQEQTKGAVIHGFSKETEHGQTLYEVETTVHGHGKDITISPAGAVVETEEETALDRLPAPAADAIRRSAARAKIVKVETVTGANAVRYEATLSNGHKHSEVVVDAAGNRIRE